MIAKIIPIKRLPLRFSFFDYIVPDALSDIIRVGQLVHIPFRGKTDFGLVMSLNEKSDIGSEKLKPVEGIAIEAPLLADNIISYLIEISEFYRAPLGFVLKSALLPLQKRKIKRLTGLPPLPNIRAAAQQKPELICYSTARELENLVNEKLSGGGQKLILVPELYQLDLIRKKMATDNIFYISGDISDKDFFELWLKVRSEKNITIIGTRRALFLPWIDLRIIIMEDEGNPSYKSWDMTPRIHTRDASLMLSKHTGSRLSLMSHSPSVESYYFSDKKVYNFIERPKNILKKGLTFVDMAAQRRGRNYSTISNDLLEAIRMTDGDSYLLINKYGSAQFVSCQDCGYVFRCDNCQRPMTYFDDKDKKLSCHFCKKESVLPDGCPNCQGFSMRFSNLGTDGVAAELKKLLGNDTPKIITINKMEAGSLARLDEPGKKIIVGTEYAWSSIDWKKISLFALVDPDIAFMSPEYKSIEDLWQIMRSAQFNIGDDSDCIIQTNQIAHPVFMGLNNPQMYYDFELETRSIFSYPPFNYLIKIYNGNSDRGKAAHEAAQICQKFRLLTDAGSGAKIFGPMPAAPAFARGKYWQIILLKLCYASYKKTARDLLKDLPEDWKVDPNPNNILGVI